MLDSRWRKVLRDLRLHGGRTLLVILAIATGLAGAGTILVKYALVTQATEHDYLASNPPSARLFVERVTAEALERVGSVEGVREVEARRTLSGSIWIDGERDSVTLVAADGLGELAIGRIGLEEGRWPRDGEVVVERSSLRRTPVSTGEEVGLAISSTAPVTLPIVGIVHDVGVAPAWMEQQIYVYTTPATLAGLDEPTELDELRFTVGDATLDREAVRSLAERAAAEVEALGLGVHHVIVPPPGEHIHAGQMNSLFFVQAALGLLALLFSGTLVYNLMTAILVGQQREIGMMKAIGASNGQIATLYLVMVGLLGAAASVLAIPTAAIAGRRYAALTLLALNFEPSEVQIPLWALLLPAAAGIALALTAAAVPVARGVRTTVAEAIRDHGVPELPPRWGLAERALASLGLPRPILLSLRNTLRRRGRLALTLLSLTVGGALFMGALNLRASIQQSTDDWFAGTENDLVVRLARPFPSAKLEESLARVPGVTAVEALGDVGATLASGGSPPFALVFRSAESSFAGSRLVAGRWLEVDRWLGADDAPGSQTGQAAGETTGELVVNRAWLARVRPARLGEVVTLRVGELVCDWRIVGILETSPLSALAYASWEDGARLLGIRREARSAVVRIDPANPDLLTHIEMVRQRDGGAEPTFIERIHGMGPDPSAGLDDPRTVRSNAPRLFEVILEGGGYPVSTVLSMASVRQGLEDHMVLVVDLLGVMALLVIAVGGFGLATTMSLAVLERTSEIGILRAIGASHPAIRRLVAIEALFIAAMSWLLAVPLSLPMSYALGRVFGQIMMQLPIRFSGAPAAAVLWLALSLLLAWLASLWPAIRATRLTPREALAR